MTEMKGACLCGAVQATVKNIQNTMGACHCNRCRKWSGSPFFAVDCGTEVRFENAENISVFDSSDWAERAFCAKCGTHLYFRLKKQGKYMMPAGFFDQHNDLQFVHQVFIDQKPPYYDFSNETQNMTGEECMAAFAASSCSD